MNILKACTLFFVTKNEKCLPYLNLLVELKYVKDRCLFIGIKKRSADLNCERGRFRFLSDDI